MIDKYTDDKATQMVLALLKAHGIKKVIASPGTTNIALVAGMQLDPWFEMYSSVDERSAAYMACGLSSESGEPVVITCTGATASRNYYPGITEAYYRKLPILAITGFQSDEAKGHLYAQSLDRTVQPKDSFIMSVEVGKIRDYQDEWLAEININSAILELTHRGGGPVHINLREATYGTFNTEKIPEVRKISRYVKSDSLPEISNKTIAFFIGAHKTFSPHETKVIEEFCEKYDAVVFADHTSGYYGKYKIQYSLLGTQANINCIHNVDLLLHIGEVSGDYYSLGKIQSTETWRISEDGIIRDRFKNLTNVFEMSITDFCSFYISLDQNFKKEDSKQYEECVVKYNNILENIPELPFGNIWIAKHLHDKLPQMSILHLGILNTLRSWNFFELDNTIKTSCNVGGFGIDGILSTSLGASLANKGIIHFVVTGDLAFFYDINSIGNRHVCSNLRVLLINNGKGTEFRNYDHPASKWGDEADLFFAAGGHFGNQSPSLVKCYAENLGFNYYSANNKEEFLAVIGYFLDPNFSHKPLLLEVMTNSIDESNALRLVRHIIPDNRSFFEKVYDKSKFIINNIVK